MKINTVKKNYGTLSTNHGHSTKKIQQKIAPNTQQIPKLTLTLLHTSLQNQKAYVVTNAIVVSS